MEKYYNFETIFHDLRDALKTFLRENNIYYELSFAYGYYHFEILATSNQAKAINVFLDNFDSNFVNQ